MKSGENEMGETKASTGEHLAMVCDTLDCDIADVIILVRDESSRDE